MCATFSSKQTEWRLNVCFKCQLSTSGRAREVGPRSVSPLRCSICREPQRRVGSAVCASWFHPTAVSCQTAITSAQSAGCSDHLLMRSLRRIRTKLQDAARKTYALLERRPVNIKAPKPYRGLENERYWLLESKERLYQRLSRGDASQLTGNRTQARTQVSHVAIVESRSHPRTRANTTLPLLVSHGNCPKRLPALISCHPQLIFPARGRGSVALLGGNVGPFLR